MSKFFARARDPISSFTHLIGAVLSVIGTFIFIFKGVFVGAELRIILSTITFGLSLVALYTASTIYHFAPYGKKLVAVLRRLDHSMIYVLIAGSYTPILIHYFPEGSQLIYTAVIWAIAAAGISVRMLWFSAPRWLYTGFYVLMGWFILISPSSLAGMERSAMLMLLAGGLSYTIGGIFYAFKWPNPSESFGAHEVFHLLVLGGSLMHYLTVLLYVL